LCRFKNYSIISPEKTLCEVSVALLLSLSAELVSCILSSPTVVANSSLTESEVVVHVPGVCCFTLFPVEVGVFLSLAALENEFCCNESGKLAAWF
jgi:hypothetical protein